MKKEIFWRILLNTSKKEKANKLIDEIQQILLNTRLIKSEIYWKDSSLYLVELQQYLNFGKTEGYLLEVHKNISFVSNQWTINTSYYKSSEDVDFSGVSESSIRIIGINWISFILQDMTE